MLNLDLRELSMIYVISETQTLQQKTLLGGTISRDRQ